MGVSHMIQERQPPFYGESSRQMPDGNDPKITGEEPCNGLIHNSYWRMLSPLGDSKLCFRLTKTGRFNGEYTDKPLLISSSSVAFYISNYNSFEITKQIEPNVVSLSVYFMSESLVCYVAKFVFIMKKSAYENKIFR